MTQPVYILGGYQTDFAKSWARNGQDISDMVLETTQGVLEN
jgi:acetyl-CoA C-acetyltransferase